MNTSEPDLADRRTRDRTAGQAAIELALSLPLLLLWLLAVIQVGLIIHEQLHLESTVRAAARAAARSVDPRAAATEVTVQLRGEHPTGVEVTAFPGPVPGTEMIEIRLVTTPRLTVPLIGAMMTSRSLTAAATMAREPAD